MKKLFLKSITLKILAFILFISLLENFLLIYMSNTLSLRTIEDQIDERSMKSAELYSDNIGNWVMERMKEIEIYAACTDVRSMDWDIAEPYLQHAIKSKLGIYDHFMIVDLDGNYNTTLKRNPGNASDRAYFQAAKSGRTVISEPLISRTNGNAVAVVAAPIWDQSGRIVGVMAGTINLIKFSRMIENFKYDHADSYSYIVNRYGLIIAHPNQDYILKENISKQSAAINESVVSASTRILHNVQGKVRYTFNNTESFSYYHEIPNTNGWKIIIKIPLDYWLDPIRKIRNSMAAASVAAMLLAIILGATVAKSISHPIIRLKDVFVKATTGDLSARAAVESEDEVGQASSSFNRMMEQVSHLTYHDTLTGLPNRLMFTNHLGSVLKEAAGENGKVAVMVMDIDRFGNINNTLGHSVGDRLLVNLSSKITGCLSPDEVLSRIGEDKFVLLLRHATEQKDILDKARTILELVKQPLIIDDYRLYVTAGIGIAFYPEDGINSAELFKNAYSAMQRAKRIGRDNMQLYDATASYKLMEQLYLDSSMHHALGNNELLLHYQPQVDVASGRIIGCEVLLRWQHPELGLVSPAKFIPIAEANGLIVSIGEWVLKTACTQNKYWQDTGHDPIYISVNISGIQLLQENFVEMVSGILQETGLQPQYLELEITESIAMENTEYIPEILSRLSKLGVRIALDDFGTGYSSLNYLKNFAITTLKIDQSFIRDLTVSPKDAAIVSTILAMGRHLKLNVTAEGVETSEQMELLKNENCDILQGYLFSKPVPVDEFEKFLA